jgi:hypothetical protein
MNINDSNLYFFNRLSRMFKHLQDLIGILRLRDTSELLSAMLPCFPGSHLQIEFATEKMKVLKRHFVPFFSYSYCRFSSWSCIHKDKSNRLFIIISFNNQNKFIYKISLSFFNRDSVFSFNWTLIFI